MKLKSSLVLAMALILTGCDSTTIPKATVMITNFQSNSGGSGSVIKSTPAYSEVLTNAHVCGVIQNGGLVHTYDGKEHYVVSYKVSPTHDLCLIRVLGNLGSNLSVSPDAPNMYDRIAVSGHPRLLPNIISVGHISGRRIVQVMTGMRPCTVDELKDPGTAFICMFVGAMPVIKTYEAVAISATIQPGSSGSAVFDEFGDIGAVVFAGSGDFGYGFAVPQEYIAKFVHLEAPVLPPLFPKNDATAQQKSSTSVKNLEEKLAKACETIKSPSQQKICDMFTRNVSNDLVQR